MFRFVFWFRFSHLFEIAFSVYKLIEVLSTRKQALMRKKIDTRPAEYVIQSFGSGSEVARVLGIDKSTVSRWNMPREKKGTNGTIPQKYWSALITEAAIRSIPLTVVDLSGL